MKRGEIKSWLMDMDGVLVHEEQAIPGADRVPGAAARAGYPLPAAHQQLHLHRPRPGGPAPRQRARRAGGGDLDLGARHGAVPRTTSAPAASAFVIGEAGLTTALHDAGYTLTERAPDYVVLGETRTYSFERITQAIRLVADGARFIATNPDPTGATADGPLPGDRLGGGADQPGHRGGAVLRRQAQPADDALGAERHRRPLRDHRDDRRPHGHRHRRRARGRAETILVLTGVTSPGTVERFPYRPSRIVDSIADLVDELG